MKYIIIISLLAVYSCNSSNNTQPDKEPELLGHVGDIPFDSISDDINFEPCHEDLSAVHYNFNNPDLYEGEKPAIVNEFKKIDTPAMEGIDGFITIRFMVNCEGKTGRFRVEELDFDYNTKKFDDDLVNSILTTTKNLDGWIPATHENRAFDYYKYLTFKIIDNQIADILP